MIVSCSTPSPTMLLVSFRDIGKEKQRTKRKGEKKTSVSLPFHPHLSDENGPGGPEPAGLPGRAREYIVRHRRLRTRFGSALLSPSLSCASSPLHLCCNCSSVCIGGFLGDFRWRSNLRFSVVFRIPPPPPRPRPPGYSYLSSELLIIFLLSEIPAFFPLISSFKTCCASAAVCSGDVRGCFPSFLDTFSIFFRQFSIIFLRSEIPPLFPPISSF